MVNMDKGLACTDFTQAWFRSPGEPWQPRPLDRELTAAFWVDVIGHWKSEMSSRAVPGYRFWRGQRSGAKVGREGLVLKQGRRNRSWSLQPTAEYPALNDRLTHWRCTIASWFEEPKVEGSWSWFSVFSNFIKGPREWQSVEQVTLIFGAPSDLTVLFGFRV